MMIQKEEQVQRGSFEAAFLLDAGRVNKNASENGAKNDAREIRNVLF